MGKILLQSRAEAGVLTGFTHLSQMTANMIKSWGCFLSISLCTCIPMETSLPRLHKMVNIMNNVPCKCCQNIDFSILKYLRWFQFSIHRYYQLCFLSLFSQTFTFTFMHLADAFIQSDLQCIQAKKNCQYVNTHEHCRVMITFVNNVHQNYGCLATKIIWPKKKLFQCLTEKANRPNKLYTLKNK